MKNLYTDKSLEIWKQDYFEPELWHNDDSGLIVSSDLLEEREFYYQVIKMPFSHQGQEFEQAQI